MPKLDYDSDLIRKKWMREGLVQAASKSFWTPFTGTSKDSVVFQSNNENAAEGHTVVFDFEGNLSQKPVKGKEQAFGKGETKKKFSDKLTVERYRLVVDNGDKFDAVEIGDLGIAQHQDSRSKLGDLFVRFKDQAIFDCLQGIADSTNSHVIDLGTTFDYNSLLEIEKTLRTSQGFTTGGVRRPLEPYIMSDGNPLWLFVIDNAMANKIKSSSNYQNIVINSDVRGNNNRAIKGVLGKLGSMLIVEADTFFGKTFNTGTIDIGDSNIEIAGLRQYDVANSVWTGMEGFDYASTLNSRGRVLGQSANLIGMGKMPDYKFQESTDFGIKSESALEVWMQSQKCRLLEENGDYDSAKVTGIDWGCIAVDVEL